MPRDRRRLRDIMVYSLPYAGAMALSILAVSSLMSNIHASAVAHSPRSSGSSSSYLYDTVETFPVMDHGMRGQQHDFTKSTSPKVVEFYDPKCGACRAFRSNYAETARRVLARRPDVEFYGVSCEAHPDVCSRYAGGKSVPRIFAFPNGGGGNGIEVPKGAGTVHFLSERLIKALRDTGEVASDAARLGLSESSETTKRLLRARRFDEGSDDQDAQHEDATAEEEGEERDASEDREEETHENDEDEESEDREGSHEDDEGGLDRIDAPPPTAADRASDDDERDGDSKSERGKKSTALENISGDGVSEEQKRLEKRMRLGQVQRQQVRQPLQDQQQQQREKRQQQQPKQLEPKQEQQPKRPEQKQQQQQQQQMQKQQPKQQDQLEQIQILQPKHQEQKQTKQQLKQIVINEDSEEKNSGSQDRRGAPDDGQEQSEDQDSDTQQVVIEQTDAYKNTKEHFDRLDIQHGTESGHHFEKYKKARAAFKESQSVRGSLPVEGATSQKVDVVDGQQMPKNAPGPVGSVNAQSRTVVSKVEDRDKDWGGEFVSEGKYAPQVIETDLMQSVKFREYVARRKEILERKEKMKHPINALLGKVGANKQGGVTAVSSPMRNYKAQFNMTAGSRQIKVPDLRPEAQQKSLGKKILKKIPIVKRVFKRSKGEETLIDASLSFTRGLMSGLYKTTSLTYKQKAALLDWFDLLSVTLPPEIGLHELIDTLKHNVDEISEQQVNLKLIIDKHPLPEKDWSLSCRKGMKPFFCGFWKLLHIMSVGFAEQAGGLALRESSPSIRIFSAKQAANVVREYIALFFPCAECSQYFVARYDDCSFQRCHRLSDETVDASGESWQEFPLWLWEVHNDVSSYKLKKEVAKFDAFGRKDEAKQWERDMKVLFPQMDQCSGCITSDGTWNLNAVYNHLEYEYWTFGYEVHPKVDQFLEYNAVERDSGQFKWVYYLMLTFVFLVMARFTLARKLRVMVTGRHKKDDTLSFGRFPRNKFRDS